VPISPEIPTKILAHHRPKADELMTITSFARSALAILAAGALAAPVAAEANGSPHHGLGQSSRGDAHPGKGRDKAKRNPTVTYVLKGTVVSADAAAGTAVVEVAKVNHQRHAGQDLTVTFDLTKAKIAVADVNADGVATSGDIAAGDRVLVQARLPRRSPDLTGTVVARTLVDQTHPAPETNDPSAAPATA
jgi:hypothetical protein